MRRSKRERRAPCKIQTLNMILFDVFTSKHHDGFAMFRSKASKFNVVDATPFGRLPVSAVKAVLAARS